MKKLIIFFMTILVSVSIGCKNGTTDIDTEVWQRFAGSAGVGFWAFGNDPDNPEAMLVFFKTSSVSRVEYWEGQEKKRSAEWLDCTEDTITYRAPNKEVFTQAYTINNNGLFIDESSGIIWGGIFWRREKPSWWLWEFSGSWFNTLGSLSNLTGGNGIGFWGNDPDDPDDPVYMWVFINTSSVSRIEFWINRQLSNWGHWIDVTGNTIMYRQHDYINPVTQWYYIKKNTTLWIDEHASGMAWGGPWQRFEQPEWWKLEQH